MAEPPGNAAMSSGTRPTIGDRDDPAGTHGIRTDSPPPSSPAPSATSDTDRGWLLGVLLLVVGNFMAVLDVTVVNVAMPAIQKHFGGSLEDVLWIATAYTLMLGLVVPLSGWLGDRFGLTAVYGLSLVAFAVGSALCGFAWDLHTLIAFRVLQAIPGGVMPVVSMTLVYRIVPPAKIGTAMGIFGLGVVFAPAVGPVLGGYLVQYATWRWVFLVNVPVGLLGALAAYLSLPNAAGTKTRRFDLPGFLTIGLGLFALLLAAEKGTDWGWDGYRVRMLFVFAALALALFVIVELEVDQPLLDLRVFRRWPFTSSFLILCAVQVNLLGLAFLVPVFLQQGQRLNALNAGLVMLPGAVAAAVFMPFVGRIYDKIGPRWLSVCGLAITAYGTYLLGDLTISSTRGEVIAWTSIRAVGLGLSLMPIMTAALAALPPSHTNQGSVLINVGRQTSGALGLAVLTALATHQQAQLLADRAALTPTTTPATPHPASALPPPPESIGNLYSRYQLLSAQILATSYANLFLIIAALVAACVLLALTRHKPHQSDH